jgi:transposase
MGRPGRKAVPVVLTGAVKRELEALAEDPGVSARHRLRAQIVLGAARGGSNRRLAEQLGCSEATVSAWRSRFVEQGVAGLADARGGSSARPRGRPATPVEISEADRQVLGRWTRRHTVS